MASDIQFDVKSLLDQISLNENIENPVSKFVYKTEKGDGYLGVINAVEIRGTNKNLSLILKSSPPSKELREKMPIEKAFIREIYFYDDVMPQFRKFQEDNGLKNRFTSAPKCFITNKEYGKELLVLENIRTQGYNLWDRKIPMNSEHVEFVFREYAKFHGTSIAMKKTNKKLYDKTTVGMKTDIMIEMFESVDLFSMVTKATEKIKPLFCSNAEAEISAVFNEFSDHCKDHFFNACKPDEHAVIIQGDCWCNNMMFKHQDPKNPAKPESMRLLDFQVLKLGSVACDLSYFFYACASKELLDKLPYFLDAYHDSLTAFLKQFDLDAAVDYPKSLLIDQWRKFSKYGLIMSFLAIKAMLSDSSEAPDFTAAAENGDFGDVFTNEIENEEDYKRRVKDVIVHCFDNNYI